MVLLRRFETMMHWTHETELTVFKVAIAVGLTAHVIIFVAAMIALFGS